MATRDSVAQLTSPGPIVTLFDLDLTVIGVPEILHFTSGTNPGSLVPVTFQGVQYTPIELKSSGWAASGTGPFPQPEISVSNVNEVFTAMLMQYQDLIGGKLTRKRLFRSFLDDGVNAGQGNNALFAVDLYYLYQKTAHDKKGVTWKLASAVDQEGQQLPARLVIRDSCQFQYRNFNTLTGTFDYSYVDCPYTGGAFYDSSGNSTSAQLDVCGKRISDCKLRFGGAGYLPFGGFPGAGMGTV